MRDPKKNELNLVSFNAIWDAIKEWDISTEEDIKPDNEHRLYTTATGNHVCRILDALREKGFDV